MTDQYAAQTTAYVHIIHTNSALHTMPATLGSLSALPRIVPPHPTMRANQSPDACEFEIQRENQQRPCPTDPYQAQAAQTRSTMHRSAFGPPCVTTVGTSGRHQHRSSCGARWGAERLLPRPRACQGTCQLRIPVSSGYLSAHGICQLRIPVSSGYLSAQLQISVNVLIRYNK
jgi:hypothetical protein